MERHEVLTLMSELKLAGMKAAYDEVMSNVLKRQHRAGQTCLRLRQCHRDLLYPVGRVGNR